MNKKVFAVVLVVLIIGMIIFYENKRTCDDDTRMSLCYDSALINYDNGKFAQSVMCSLEAEEIAVKNEDYYCLGQLYHNLKNIYGKTYNVEEELKYAKLSYSNFLKTDSTKWINISYMDLGSSYINVGEYDKGLVILRNALSKSQEQCDTICYPVALRLYAEALAVAGYYLESKKHILLLVENDNADCLKSRNYKDLALAYEAINELDSANYYLEIAAIKAEKENDVLLLHRINYEKAKIFENEKQVIASLENMMFSQDSMLRKSMNYGLLSARELYAKERIKLTKIKAEQDKAFYFWIIILILICTASVIVYGVLRYKADIRHKDEELALVKEYVKESNILLDSNNTDLSRMNLLIKKMFGQRFKMINDLCDTYFECQNSQREKNAIYKEAISIISAFEEEETLIELESIINECNDNVMVRIREQIPELTEKDIKLLLYIYSGFSSRAVCLFTKDKIENYYNRKSRLKTKMKRSEAKDISLFMQMLDNQKNK